MIDVIVRFSSRSRLNFSVEGLYGPKALLLESLPREKCVLCMVAFACCTTTGELLLRVVTQTCSFP